MEELEEIYHDCKATYDHGSLESNHAESGSFAEFITHLHDTEIMDAGVGSTLKIVSSLNTVIDDSFKGEVDRIVLKKFFAEEFISALDADDLVGDCCECDPCDECGGCEGCCPCEEEDDDETSTDDDDDEPELVEVVVDAPRKKQRKQ